MVTEQNSPSSFKVTLKLVFSLSFDPQSSLTEKQPASPAPLSLLNSLSTQHTISQRCFGNMMIYVGGATDFTDNAHITRLLLQTSSI